MSAVCTLYRIRRPTPIPFAQADSTSRNITRFDIDLSDGVVLAKLILSHIPSLKRLTSLYQFCSEGELLLHNANNVIGAMKELGLEYSVSAKDITEPNAVGQYLSCEAIGNRR